MNRHGVGFYQHAHVGCGERTIKNRNFVYAHAKRIVGFASIKCMKSDFGLPVGWKKKQDSINSRTNFAFE